ncbi:dynactin p62 family-domain-containing protein [Nemania sp. NC0429]|nr:dynactin p62 family-domain-containing protein [Nemania sp. NC0429]
MASLTPSFTPYTYIQCPCHDDSTSQDQPADDPPTTTTTTTAATITTTTTKDGVGIDDDVEDDDHAFDPRAHRSTFSLYPLEYLLYCDVCHQIRCPRCVTEELVSIYCPNCLFEVGSTSLKSDGNRCTRSCFQCPICIGPLAVQALEPPPEPALLTADSATAPPPSAGPWVLTCSYCHWNSSEIGVKFDKPQGIFGQLQKLRGGEEQQSKHHVAAVVGGGGGSGGDTTKPESVPETTKARFKALKSFYASQTVDTNPSAGLAGLGDYGLSSPGALTRIMSIYSGSNVGGLKQKSRSAVMREADAAGEGFRPSDLDEGAAVSQLRRDGWHGTVTGDQGRNQAEEGARFADQLWPIPSLFRAKRSKRCPVCRHIISKPEAKVGNTRWRIRLIANNSIPSISVKPFPSPLPSPSGLLRPLQPAQFLLTFRNPLFDDVKVTLATPATTPGRFASRVTVLCPEFHIDANPDNDMYLDDVLKDGDRDAHQHQHQQQRRGGGDDGGGAHHHHHHHQHQQSQSQQQQAEAGKVWERGRNWVSIVVEVVPASLRTGSDPDLGPLGEDEDILEIPMFVRLEWESEASQDQVGAAASRDKDVKEKRELAYWCVIGVGRISQE